LLSFTLAPALVAWVFWTAWVLETVDPNDPNRVHGWEAMYRAVLPGMVLLVPVVLGVLIGVRACRLGDSFGLLGIWANAFSAYVLTLVILVSGTVEALLWEWDPKLAGLPEWLSFAVAFLLVAPGIWLALRASRRALSTGAPPRADTAPEHRDAA
jgi:hypothetical protein